MKRMKVQFGAATITAIILLFLVSSALAQPRDNPIERARHYMEIGQDAFSKGNYEEASEQFVNAYTASPFSAFLYNAALAEEKAGRNDKAVDFLRRYLEADPEASDYAQVDMKIRALLASAETPLDEETDVEISEVEMKSLISVRTNPPDAQVRILDMDGNEVSRSDGGAAQTVVRGTYTVEASHPDYRTVQTDLTVAAGQVYIVVVEMSQGAFLGFLHIKTDIPGAVVYVDNKDDGQVGTTPWGNVLPAGKHTVWIEKPGYEIVEKILNVNLGEEIVLNLELERLPFGLLNVKTNVPNAEVYVDSVLIGKAPLIRKVTPGRRIVRVAAEGMKDFEKEATIARGQMSKMLVRLNPTPSRTSAWVSLGFAAALFAGGGVFGYLALDLNNELDDARNAGRLANDDSRILEGFLWGLGADLCFGVGTIVGALSIYYFLRDPLPPSEGRLFSPDDFDDEMLAKVEAEEAELAKMEATENPVAATQTEQLPPDVEGPPAEIPIAPVESKESEPKPEPKPALEPEPESAPVSEEPQEDESIDEQLPAPSEAYLRPRILVTPVLGETAGFGLTVTF
jgi:PEGA domain/Tetratricopeptide repeat